jgi:pyrroloquinoline quinone biosynthesis protein B
MKLCILGAAAGGGVPQWNCGCGQCILARAGSPRVRPRTQDSVAVRGPGSGIGLLNASPDVAVQMARTEDLWPRGARQSPVAAVVLTNGDLDHCLGLLSLREWQPLVVYATAAVRRDLCEGNAMFRTLERFPGQSTWRTLPLDREIALGDTGVLVRAVPAPGKVPVHVRRAPSVEDNVALVLREDGRRATTVYATAVGRVDPLRGEIERAACVLFDGTFYRADEIVALCGARAEDMAHVPIGGPGGSLAALAGISARRVYTHVNNTNPILDAESAERAAVEAAGWQVAEDGMEIAA